MLRAHSPVAPRDEKSRRRETGELGIGCFEIEQRMVMQGRVDVGGVLYRLRGIVM